MDVSGIGHAYQDLLVVFGCQSCDSSGSFGRVGDDSRDTSSSLGFVLVLGLVFLVFETCRCLVPCRFIQSPRLLVFEAHSSHRPSERMMA